MILLQLRSDIDPTKVMEALGRIERMYGNLGLWLVIGLAVGIILIGTYLYFRTKGIAQLAVDKSLEKYKSGLDESVKKSMASYESKLGLELQSELGVMFRDENIRNEALSHILKDLYKIRIDLWKKVYASYFEYQESWNWTKEDLKTSKYYTQLSKLIKQREEIFINEVQLGEDLTFDLIRINTHIRSSLLARVKQLKYPIESEYDVLINREEENLNIHLEKAKKTLKEMFYTNKSIKDFELKPKESKELDEFRKQRIKDLEEDSPNTLPNEN